jgi:hypothetical protein
MPGPEPRLDRIETKIQAARLENLARGKIESNPNRPWFTLC